MMGGGSDSHGQGGAYGGGGLQGGYGSGGGQNAGGGMGSGGQGTFGGTRGQGYENSAGYSQQVAEQNAKDAQALKGASYQTFGQSMFGGLLGEIADSLIGSIPAVGQIVGLSNWLGQHGYKTGEAQAGFQGHEGGNANGLFSAGGIFNTQFAGNPQSNQSMQFGMPVAKGYNPTQMASQQTVANPLVLPDALSPRQAQQTQVETPTYNLF